MLPGRSRLAAAGFFVLLTLALGTGLVLHARTVTLSRATWIAPAAGGTVSVDVTATVENEPWTASAEPVVSTLAGSTAGIEGFADGVGTDARFAIPNHVAADEAGNVYVADWSNHRVRKVTPAGVVTTVAGSGVPGGADGTGAGASFNGPRGIAIDASGTLYVAESWGHRIRRISPAGVVTTVAGNGTAGYVDANGSAARFWYPSGIAVDGDDNLYVTEEHNSTVRRITPAGDVTTLAGNGTAGYVDATGTAARFHEPYGVAVDVAGNVYVADSENHRIRKVTPAGVVTTVAGSGTPGTADGAGAAAQFDYPWGLVVDGAGNIYVADLNNHRIRRIAPDGSVTTLAGSGSGYADGTAAAARFTQPVGVTLTDEDSVLVIAERNGGNRVRRMTSGAEWLTVSPASGAGSGSVTLTAAASASPFPRTASIVIAGQPVVVTQEGVTTAMRVSPSPLDFGTVQVGSDPVDRSLTVENTSSVTLSGWSWSFGGLGNPVGGTCGSAVANPTGLYSLAPGQSCTFVLRFTPTSVGQHGGTLYVGMRTPTAPAGGPDVTWNGSWTAAVQEAPTTGSISGTVRDAGTGAPLAGVTVYVYNAAGASVGSVVATDAAGVYVKSGLATGSYYLRTSNSLGYIDELYNDLPCAGGACSPYTNGAGVGVTAGVETSGINFALAAGGTITGVVTSAASGAPLAGMTVYVYNAAGASVGSVVATDAAGVYVKSGLATGSYYLRSSNGLGYVDEFYRDIPCPGGACRNTEGSEIVVVSGATTSGIDLALSAGGSISGIVRAAATGQPLQNVTVIVYVLDAGGWWGLHATTDAAGRYTRTGLSTGTYYVRTSNSLGYIDELYGDIACTGGACTVASGTPVEVTAGATTNGIDFGLVAGGTITGVVTNAASGAPLAGVTVYVYNAAGTSVGSVTTNAAGVYVKSGLATGSYYLRTSNGLGYVDELYNDLPCAGGACSPYTNGTGVSVTAGAATTGVNFALAAGGTITGVVTSAASGAPLTGVTVQAYNAAGTSVGSVTTDAAGVYVKSGLATGSYYLRTSNSLGYIDELHRDMACTGGACTVASGTPVEVTTGVTTDGINFGLVAGGTITGVVIDTASGAPLAGVTVSVYNATGTSVGSATTNTAGVYVKSGLGTGNYYLRTSNSLGYIDELYGDMPCTGGACTVTLGTPVSVTTGVTTNNISFGLVVGGAIAGLVTDAVSAAPLRTITVQVYNAAGASVGSVRPNALGMYQKTGLATGSYYVRTSNSLGYIDELYDGRPCPDGACAVTTGTGVTVTAGATTTGIDFGLGRFGGGDFTGDHNADILWRHATLGDVWLWPMDGAARTAETYVRTVADTNWEIRGLGDQTGDGKADILWRNKTTGAIYLWPMDGSTPLSETYVATVDPAYDIVGTGDFNGDGKSDILWRHLTNGEVWVWLMDGAMPLNQIWVGTVDPAYVIKGVGDLDGDGRADIVWHHATAGDVWVWLMDGATPRRQTWVGTVPDVGYQVAGVADYDGDSKADMLWRHATRGEVWLWRMDGATRQAETWVGTVPDTGYRIVGTGDYDGDGKADILWHHATAGEVWVWLMDGSTPLSQTWVGTVPDPGYQIVKVK